MAYTSDELATDKIYICVFIVVQLFQLCTPLVQISIIPFLFIFLFQNGMDFIKALAKHEKEYCQNQEPLSKPKYIKQSYST